MDDHHSTCCGSYTAGRRIASAAFLFIALVAANDRVSDARARRSADVETIWRNAGLSSAPTELYVRAFKKEGELELWGGPRGAALVLLKTYPICYASGELGPKRQRGDLQVPEGFYDIGKFNPSSSYHLSLEVTYPNASDRLRGTAKDLGGDIYIHGNCVSIGCISVQDEPIEEIYLFATGAKRPIRVDIYPMRLTDALLTDNAAHPHIGLWRELAPGLATFAKTHRPPRFVIDKKTGAYRVLD